jgi:hypothetical protein
MDRAVKSSVFSRSTSKPWTRVAFGFHVLVALLVALGLPLGCSKTTTVVPFCDESKCATGQRCVQNECRPACTVSTASTDCSPGQSCGMWAFADGSQGAFCVVLGGSDAGADGSTIPTPVSAKCAANTDCATDQGEFCVSGTCRLVCTSHFDCQGYGECTNGVDTDGNAGHYCDLSHPQQPGQFYTHCPSGTDAECDAAAGFFCVGAGADDLDAYCTDDCTTDDTCAPGFACTPLTRNPCNDDCGLTGVPKDRMCVPSEQIGAGQPFQCGSHGVTRNVCRPRKFCTSCTSDVDCLAAPNQICAADQSGAKICTELCDTTHPSCPWGSAGVCGVWDQDLGLATCAHRFGRCVGDGKSCEPCEKDTDCGAQGACTASSFTGEHWCVDFSVTCSCAGLTVTNGLCTGGGCPMTPGGLAMSCEDDPAMTGSSPGICVGANTANGLLAAAMSPQTGCWPAH